MPEIKCICGSQFPVSCYLFHNCLQLPRIPTVHNLWHHEGATAPWIWGHDYLELPWQPPNVWIAVWLPPELRLSLPPKVFFGGPSWNPHSAPH